MTPQWRHATPPPRTCLTGYNVTAPPTWHGNKLLSPRHLAGGPGALLRQPPELTPSPSHANNTHANPPPPLLPSSPIPEPVPGTSTAAVRPKQKEKSFGRHNHLLVPSPRVGRGRQTLAEPQEARDGGTKAGGRDPLLTVQQHPPVCING